MNWNHLPLFLAIANTGTLNGAAKALNVNHSTVFRRLGELENRLKTRLFDRLPEGYVLTSAGEQMLPLALQVEDAMNQLSRQIMGRDVGLTGRVRITTAPNLARRIMPAVVAKLREDHPQIELEISAGDHDYDLSRREADLALRATSSPPATLVGRKLVSLIWQVFAPLDYPDPPAALDELTNHPVIGADQNLIRLKAFKSLSKDQVYAARCNDLSTMAELCRAGVGLAILPSDQEHRDVRPLFALPEVPGELWLLTHPDLRNVPRIRTVWDCIRQECERIFLT